MKRMKGVEKPPVNLGNILDTNAITDTITVLTKTANITSACQVDYLSELQVKSTCLHATKCQQ